MRKILLFSFGLFLSVCVRAAQPLEAVRFQEWIVSSCPVVGVSIGTYGNLATYSFTPSGSATAQQITNGTNRKATFDVSQAAYDDWITTVVTRKLAITYVDANDGWAKLIRAVLITILDELNNIRGWIAAFKAQTALATNLANLQTRVAALPDMPDRTVAQGKQAVKDEINSGGGD